MGFLRYYELKQLPNFLLATPILTLAVVTLYLRGKSLFASASPLAQPEMMHLVHLALLTFLLLTSMRMTIVCELPRANFIARCSSCYTAAIGIAATVLDRGFLL